MGLQYDRMQRRRRLETMIQQAFIDAISDAKESYDDTDEEAIRVAYLVWLDEDEIEIPKAGKALEKY